MSTDARHSSFLACLRMSLITVDSRCWCADRPVHEIVWKCRTKCRFLPLEQFKHSSFLSCLRICMSYDTVQKKSLTWTQKLS